MCMRILSRLYWLLLFLAAPTPILCSNTFTRYEEGSCQLIGDPDIYGIGVRVSYYLIFTAGIVATAAKSNKGIDDCLKGVNIVFLAVNIVLLRNAVSGSFAVVEYTISYNLAFVPYISLVPGLIRGNGNVAAWGAFCTLFGLGCIFPPWLYRDLIGQGQKPDCPSIKVYAATNLDLSKNVGAIRGVIVFWIIVAPFFFVAGFFLIISSVKGAKTLGETTPSHLIQKVMHTLKLLDSHKRRKAISVKSRIPLFVVCVGLGAFSAATVESILVQNNIELSGAEFTSTNQLIPFLVGLFTLISTVWDVCLELYSPAKGKNERNPC
ncbi:hypothetical protein F4810DRAFT_676984 [Camillea tinctor]|nr:hypothetical protein F4810DRAFT_676984 [Camillea tinctor]